MPLEAVARRFISPRNSQVLEEGSRFRPAFELLFRQTLLESNLRATRTFLEEERQRTASLSEVLALRDREHQARKKAQADEVKRCAKEARDMLRRLRSMRTSLRHAAGRLLSSRSRATGSPRSSFAFWFQVSFGLALVLRAHETCVSPSRPVPRGRPHRLGVVHGLGVIYGLEVILHLLVPSLTWIIYTHGTCVLPSRLVPRGRPHRLGVVQGLGVVHGLEVVLHLLVPSPTWFCFGSSQPRNLCFAFTPSASRSAASPCGSPKAPGSFTASRSSSTFWFHVPLGFVLVLHNLETCVSPSRLVPRGGPPPRGRPRPRVRLQPRGRPGREAPAMHSLKAAHRLGVV
nr:hypothetical protein Iba_chr14dCG6340 [Ipomoea batatas]